MALAYFITFSTYGTWLHGTDRGLGSVDREHNQFGGGFVEPSEDLEAESREAMSQPEYTMDAGRRDLVRDAIVTLANEKGWHLLAVHVRSNHVHIVIESDRDPSRLMSDLKARASRDLTRAGFENVERKRWTRHGSTRHLFAIAEVEQKVRYTLDEQGTPMAVYDGRKVDVKEPRTT
jgi:REP element-mobilizing transposase RayT